MTIDLYNMDNTVRGKSIGEAYRRQLSRYMSERVDDHMVVECWDPIKSVTTGDPTDVHTWNLNLGHEYPVFADYEFDKESPLVGGCTGQDWIDDRLYALHIGMYAERLGDQINKIVDRLNDGMHGSSTNSLVATVFTEDDLDRATIPRPHVGQMPCVTQLQFHPSRNTLHLYQTLRSQYVDLKGFGNLAAAATMLSRVCAQTDYAPGAVVEYVNNCTEYGEADELHSHFLNMREETYVV